MSLSKAQEKKAMKLWRDEASLAEIAEVLGCSVYELTWVPVRQAREDREKSGDPTTGERAT